VRIIIEDLGHLSKNISKGYSASSATTRSSKPSLGDTLGERIKDLPEKTPVKVSRAFLRAKPIVNPGIS
jgi:hypothetical protein